RRTPGRRCRGYTVRADRRRHLRRARHGRGSGQADTGAGLPDAEDAALVAGQTLARPPGPCVAAPGAARAEPRRDARAVPAKPQPPLDQRLLSGDLMRFSRIPRHVSFIPDGNRRWADERGLERGAGYAQGIERGISLLELCRDVGIEEVSIYGFTKENVRRPSDQVEAFREACTEFGMRAVAAGVALRAVGDVKSAMFPPGLRAYAE